MAVAHFRVVCKNSFIAVDDIKGKTERRPLRRCSSDSDLLRNGQFGGRDADHDQVMVIETSKQLITKYSLKTARPDMPQNLSSRGASAWADSVDDAEDFTEAPSASSQSSQSVHSSEANLPAGSTTLMLCHLPRYAYNTQSLQEEVARAGFLHVLDFIYVPPDLKKHRNRGFACLNFVHESHAARFLEAYNGKPLGSGTKVLSVCAADVQGLATLQARFQSRGSDELIAGYEPVFLRRAPVTTPTMSKADTLPGSRSKFVRPEAARATEA